MQCFYYLKHIHDSLHFGLLNPIDKSTETPHVIDGKLSSSMHLLLINDLTKIRYKCNKMLELQKVGSMVEIIA